MQLNISEVDKVHHSKLKPYTNRDGTIRYNEIAVSYDVELKAIVDVYVLSKAYADLKS